MVVNELSKDTSYRPHLYCIGIFALQKDNLRRSVPPGNYMKREFFPLLLELLIMLTLFFQTFQYKLIDLLGLLIRRNTPRKSKIADLDLVEVLTDEDIFWFEIAMKNLG